MMTNFSKRSMPQILSSDNLPLDGDPLKQTGYRQGSADTGTNTSVGILGRFDGPVKLGCVALNFVHVGLALFANVGMAAESETLQLGLSENKIQMFQSERGRTSKLRIVRGGWKGPVTVTFKGLPAHVKGDLGTATFGQVRLDDQQETAWLNLETDSMQEPGTFPITLKAYGNDLEVTKTIDLIVMAPCYRATPFLTYPNYYTGSTGIRCEWNVTAQYDLTVDFRSRPPEIRLNGDLLAEAVGNNISKCNGGSSSFALVNAEQQDFPNFSSVFSRYGSLSGRLVETINLTNGRSTGEAAIVQVQPLYVRDNGSGGTLVPVTVFMDRIPAPRLDRAVEPPGAGSISLSSDPANGYQEGQAVYVSATPASGFAFKGWTGSLTGNSPGLNLTMDSNKKIQAVFEEIKVSDINVEQPAGSGLVSGESKRTFGTVRLGASGAGKKFVIRNTGKAALRNIKVSLAGAHRGDFRIGKYPAVIEPGASSQIPVTFVPKARGARKAILKISSNDPDESIISIRLAGNGASK